MKSKILCLVQLPPPLHGVSACNQRVIESEVINDTFELQVLELRFAERLSDVGILSLTKVFAMMLTFLKLFGSLIFFRPDAVYFLTDAELRITDLSAMARMRRRIGEGTATPAEIAEFGAAEFTKIAGPEGIALGAALYGLFVLFSFVLITGYKARLYRALAEETPTEPQGVYDEKGRYYKY